MTYVITLRQVLDQNGLQHVKIVAADSGWDISEDILKNKAFAKSIDYIGYANLPIFIADLRVLATDTSTHRLHTIF